MDSLKRDFSAFQADMAMSSLGSWDTAASALRTPMICAKSLTFSLVKESSLLGSPIWLARSVTAREHWIGLASSARFFLSFSRVARFAGGGRRSLSKKLP